MKRQHYIVVGAFAVGFCLMVWLGWFFVASPLNIQIDEKVTLREEKKVKLATTLTKATQYDKFQAQAENFKRDLQFINRRLDPQFSYNEMTRIFSSLANTGGLSNFSFEFKPREPLKDAKLPNMDVVPVIIKFKSGYHAAAEFVSNAVSQNRLVVPERVMMKGDAAQGVIQCEIEFRVVLETPVEIKS